MSINYNKENILSWERIVIILSFKGPKWPKVNITNNTKWIQLQFHLQSWQNLRIWICSITFLDLSDVFYKNNNIFIKI